MRDRLVRLFVVLLLGASAAAAAYTLRGELQMTRATASADVDSRVDRLLVLTAGVTYRVPVQDLRVSLRRFPALPRSGFVIEDVARTPLSEQEERG